MSANTDIAVVLGRLSGDSLLALPALDGQNPRRVLRMLRVASRTARPATAVLCALLAMLGLVVLAAAGPAAAATGTVSGRAYLDYDDSGVYSTGHTTDGLANDVGVAGVKVT